MIYHKGFEDWREKTIRYMDMRKRVMKELDRCRQEDNLAKKHPDKLLDRLILKCKYKVGDHIYIREGTHIIAGFKLGDSRYSDTEEDRLIFIDTKGDKSYAHNIGGYYK